MSYFSLAPCTQKSLLVDTRSSYSCPQASKALSGQLSHSTNQVTQEKSLRHAVLSWHLHQSTRWVRFRLPPASGFRSQDGSHCRGVTLYKGIENRHPLSSTCHGELQPARMQPAARGQPQSSAYQHPPTWEWVFMA